MIGRDTLLILAAAFAAGLAGVWLSQRLGGSTIDTAAASPAATPLATQMKTVTLFDTPRALPAFKLTATDGSAISNAAFKGRWSLVFLGYTRCPDICPTTLQSLAGAERAWAELTTAQMPRIVFVSVDPTNDTPQKIGEYTHFFNPAIVGATADDAMLAMFAKSLGMVFMKVPTNGGDYSIDHSASVSLIDPQGRMAGLIRPPLDSAAIGADLRTLALSH
ncbi:MAG: SCO family protein [Lysobacteraceae bacterium]